MNDRCAASQCRPMADRAGADVITMTRGSSTQRHQATNLTKRIYFINRLRLSSNIYQNDHRNHSIIEWGLMWYNIKHKLNSSHSHRSAQDKSSCRHDRMSEWIEFCCFSC